VSGRERERGFIFTYPQRVTPEADTIIGYNILAATSTKDGYFFPQRFNLGGSLLNCRLRHRYAFDSQHESCIQVNRFEYSAMRTVSVKGESARSEV